MTTIKAYTDISQSKKLAEILPLESADMVIWGKDLDAIAATDAQKFMKGLKDRKMNYIPCWSLAALLGVLPNYQLQTQDDGIGILCSCNGNFNIVTADNPIDACVAMIEKLHELKML